MSLAYVQSTSDIVGLKTKQNKKKKEPRCTSELSLSFWCIHLQATFYNGFVSTAEKVYQDWELKLNATIFCGSCLIGLLLI